MEHTGRGVLALLGVGGGILGVVALVTRELKEWYAMMDRINKRSVDTGSKIASAASKAAPGFVESRLTSQRKQWEALGWTPEQAAEEIAHPETLQERMMMRRREIAAMKGGRREERAAYAKTQQEVDQAWKRRYDPTAPQAGLQAGADEMAEAERQRGEALERAGITSGEPVGRARGAWEVASKTAMGQGTAIGDTVKAFAKEFARAFDVMTRKPGGEPVPVRLEGHPMDNADRP